VKFDRREGYEKETRVVEENQHQSHIIGVREINE
jgi:hypothetical protein